MGQLAQPSTRQCLVPGDCYNMARLARLRAGGYLEIGMADNVVFLSASNWRCRSRKLGEDLLGWTDFRSSNRLGLRDPVECTLTVHHPFSRTIIHQIYDSLMARLRQEQPRVDEPDTRALLILPFHRDRGRAGRLHR